MLESHTVVTDIVKVCVEQLFGELCEQGRQLYTQSFIDVECHCDIEMLQANAAEAATTQLKHEHGSLSRRVSVAFERLK